MATGSGCVSIYSPHTGFDSAAQGINQSLLEKLGASEIVPLTPIPDDPDQLGSGRIGAIDPGLVLSEFLQKTKEVFALPTVQYVGNSSSKVHRIAAACGSGGSFLDRVTRVGCDTFITGETNFHTCLEAEANGINLVLLGHFPASDSPSRCWRQSCLSSWRFRCLG